MEEARIAALVGDFYHPAEPMMDTLQNSGAALGAAFSFFKDPIRAPWDSLDEFRALVVARENQTSPATSNDVWATDRHEKAIAEFVRRGGALIVLHSGLAGYGSEGPFYQTVRGRFLHHPSEHPTFSMRPLSPGHPIVKGFQGLSLMDEMYFVRINSAETEPLLEVFSPDYGSSCAAWAHSIGEGRAFCLTPGHRPEVLADPGYRKLLTNGIRWALQLWEP